MTLWFRARRVASLAGVLAVIVVSGWAAGHRTVSVPALFGTGGSSALLSTFLPLFWAAAVADAFAARGLAVEIRPAFRLGVLDTALFVAGTAATAAAFGAVMGALGPAVAGVGPVLIVSGLACGVTLRRQAGSAVFAVTALVLFTTLYAMNAPGARYVRVLQPDGDPWWSLGCGAVACAIAVWLLLGNRVTTQLKATERLE